MAEIENKCCGTCRYWEQVYESDETTYGMCNAPIPIAVERLLKVSEMPNNVIDEYSTEFSDGSDCNAWQGKEEVDVLERVKEFCEEQKTYIVTDLNVRDVADEILEILNGQNKEAK